MPDSDDPPGALPAESGESVSQPTTPAEDVSAGDDPQSAGESVAELPRFPRRRRRRRPRKPRLDQAPPETQIQAEEAEAEAPASGDVPAPPPHRHRRRRHRGPRPHSGSTVAPADEQLQVADSASAHVAQPGGEARDPISPEPSGDAAQSPTAESSDGKPDSPPRRRRRRRRGVRPIEAPASEAAAGESAPAVGGETGAGERRRRVPRMGARSLGDQAGGSSVADADGGHRSRGPRQRRGPVEGRPDRKPREADPAARGRTDGRPGSGRSGVEGRDRDPRERSRGRGQSGRTEGRRGRDRDEPRKQPERRLYALESVVDRGFEDVADEAGDSEARRVHWTIIKRMVADQNSGKAISAVYVLQREGVDTEFPSLGTARAAANKTIVHPEKLTISKAEHAAAKGDGAATERTRRQR